MRKHVGMAPRQGMLVKLYNTFLDVYRFELAPKLKSPLAERSTAVEILSCDRLKNSWSFKSQSPIHWIIRVGLRIYRAFLLHAFNTGNDICSFLTGHGDQNIQFAAIPFHLISETGFFRRI